MDDWNSAGQSFYWFNLKPLVLLQQDCGLEHPWYCTHRSNSWKAGLCWDTGMAGPLSFSLYSQGLCLPTWCFNIFFPYTTCLRTPSKVSISTKAEASSSFQVLGPELEQHDFCHISLIETKKLTQPWFKGRRWHRVWIHSGMPTMSMSSFNLWGLAMLTHLHPLLWRAPPLLQFI